MSFLKALPVCILIESVGLKLSDNCGCYCFHFIERCRTPSPSSLLRSGTATSCAIPGICYYVLSEWIFVLNPGHRVARSWAEVCRCGLSPQNTTSGSQWSRLDWIEINITFRNEYFSKFQDKSGVFPWSSHLRHYQLAALPQYLFHHYIWLWNGRSDSRSRAVHGWFRDFKIVVQIRFRLCLHIGLIEAGLTWTEGNEFKSALWQPADL
jgi:hypothetical protein